MELARGQWAARKSMIDEEDIGEMFEPEKLGICPICGGTEFVPGFGGRVLPSGKMPYCPTCKSAERHRMVRVIYDKLQPQIATMRALQFAPDGSVNPGWFASYDFSVFGGHNSLDMTDTGLDAGAYDLILSNHVIEHVESDLGAMRECLRVVGPEGIVHVNAPSTSFRYSTVDWGFADPDRNEHYRDYGADLGRYLLKGLPDTHCVAVPAMDPVTYQTDTVYFFSPSANRLQTFTKPLMAASYPCVVVA